MKVPHIISLLLFSFFCLSGFAQEERSLFTVDTIPVGEALAHKGEYKSFCDRIAKVRKLEAGGRELYMVRIGEGSDGLELVIWEDDARKFPEAIEEFFKAGAKICVIGQISVYGGSPRLEIGTPRQVHRVEE